MLNQVIMQGRLVNEPELKQTTTGTSVLTFTVASERDFRTSDGRRESDFFDCVAWKGSAEFITKYFHKGDMILVTGRLQNRTYQTNDGSNRKVTEVVVESVNFCGSKSERNENTNNASSGNEFVNIPDGVMDDGLPFN